MDLVCLEVDKVVELLCNYCFMHVKIRKTMFLFDLLCLFFYLAEPDTSQYQWDASTGYYYDPTTGLYYDANSQVTHFSSLNVCDVYDNL